MTTASSLRATAPIRTACQAYQRMTTHTASAWTPYPRVFTRDGVDRIRSLLPPAPDSAFHIPPHSVFFSKKPASEAAVLIPLLNVDGEAHVLMELRASHMRTHSGEMSFPGGKADKEDVSLVQTALRETQEELVIPRDNVEVLGTLPPQYSLGNKSRVWPMVGFVHPSSPAAPPSGDPVLPSYPLDELRRSVDEVDHILSLPLRTLCDPARQSIHYFRLDVHRPYQKIRVTDLLPEALVRDRGEVEIWGLSGWFLNVLAWRLGWWPQPVASAAEED